MLKTSRQFIFVMLVALSQLLSPVLANAHDADAVHLSDDCAVCVISFGVDDDLDLPPASVTPFVVFFTPECALAQAVTPVISCSDRAFQPRGPPA